MGKGFRKVATNLEEIIRRLSPERRAKVERRAAELLSEVRIQIVGQKVRGLLRPSPPLHGGLEEPLRSPRGHTKEAGWSCATLVLPLITFVTKT